jgi:hypothetical protein
VGFTFWKGNHEAKRTLSLSPRCALSIPLIEPIEVMSRYGEEVFDITLEV